jgi:hypothetical protein
VVGHAGVFDDETLTLIDQTYQRADAFLFGRRTYELFAGYWGAEKRARAALEDPGNHRIAAALNTKPKYLASTTLTSKLALGRGVGNTPARRPSFATRAGSRRRRPGSG